MSRRAQVVTMDMLAGILIFLVFVGAFLSLVFLVPRDDPRSEMEFELLYVFENLQENTRLTPALAFYKDYRVDEDLLSNFESSVADIDPYLIGVAGNSSGLGLSPDAYDMCLYFTDNDGSTVQIKTKKALGKLRGSDCDKEIKTNKNPCGGYERAMTVFRPVLFDTGDVQKNRILQMNVVACKVA
jgi:hypothetical protein